MPPCPTYAETKSSVRTRNIGGIQGGRWPDKRECNEPMVVHCTSGGDQLENKYEGHSPTCLERRVEGEEEDRE